MQIDTTESKKGFWNFYRDGVTQSLVQTWLYCPRQCELAYFHGFASAKLPDHLLYGNIVHHALQRAYESNELPLPGNILNWLREYDEMIGNYQAPKEIQKHNELFFARAEVMLTIYCIKYKSDFGLDWKFTEEEVDIPFQFETDKRTIRLRGKLDACHRHKNSNKLWLMDHKNLSRFDVEKFTKLLNADFQVNFYLYCCYKKYNEVPAGFKYNILRSPSIKPDGRKKPPETIDEYKDRLYKDILKRPDHYFKRVRILVDEKHILDWEEKQLKPILNHMKLWWDSGFKFPGYYNPVALETKYGMSAYADMILLGDLTGLTKKDRPFVELDA